MKFTEFILTISAIETRLKTVNSGGKNLGFGDERSLEKT